MIRTIGKREPRQIREEAALSVGKCVTDHPQLFSIWIIAKMSYLVLARKLRPAKFKDIIGQDAICKTLVNAINDDRVAHAFLFTGPRGTGKTSCARILTKALNCRLLVDSEPCNQCENCREINRDISPDVLEIDAASNRGIEHIRELREGVKFSPAKSKYKTYIIDEAHMLTAESFNALLKTLEEPPAHVKFILATTDHYKIPPTVISRCQRYDFSNIPAEPMINYLRKVAEDEKITISDSALYLIARTSVGGMRDALTILDMLISFSRDEIKDEKVIEILGLNDVREIDDLLKFIIERDAAAALSLWRDLLMKGRSITRLVADLMKAVKNLNMVKILPENKIQWRRFLPDQLALYKELAPKITVSSLQRLFDIILEVESQIKRSSQASICFEMGLIKMCSLESLAGVAEIVSVLREAGGKIASERRFTTKKPAVEKPVISNQTQVVPEKDLTQSKTPNQPTVKDAEPKTQKYYPKNLTSEENVLEVNESSENEENEFKKTQIPDRRTLKNNKSESQTVPAEQQESKLERWRTFITHISKDTSDSLVSLLNNSTVLELNNKKLTIGYGNIKIFDEEKRKRINQAAKTFFNSSLEIAYQELDDKTEMVTLKDQKEKEKDKIIEEKKKVASQDQKVKNVLELFPNSRITKIEVLEEQTYV